LLFLGGLAYSGGAIVDFTGRPVLVPGVVGAHELFHLLVMAGALLHWLFVYNWADGRSAAGAAAWQGAPSPVPAFDAAPPSV
jgi:hypothetical protein